VPSGATWFEVAAVEPECFLALRAPIDLHGSRPFDTTAARPCVYSDSLWAFLLEELPGERTRLIVSGYRGSPASAARARQRPVLGAGPLDHADATVRESQAQG
jgi:hypothetical protein